MYHYMCSAIICKLYINNFKILIRTKVILLSGFPATYCILSLILININYWYLDPEKINKSVWFIELESAFCLLIGQLISYGVRSSPLCPSEIYNECWLKSKLFSKGIEKLEDKNIFGKNTKNVFSIYFKSIHIDLFLIRISQVTVK